MNPLSVRRPQVESFSSHHTSQAPASAARLSRRTLVRGAAAAGLSLVARLGVAPAFVQASDKSGAKRPIVGTGAHTYEVLDNWAQLPDHIRFGNTHAVQETADGRMVVHHTGRQSVCVLDPDGRFIEAWGDEYAGHAHGLDLRKEADGEFLYLAATGLHQVIKTDLKGEVVFKLDVPQTARRADGQPIYVKREEYVPTFTAFAPNGDFYVADGYGAGYVHRYNLQGEYLSSFGGKGNADDQTACPHGVYCDTRDPARPRLLVADREHHRLQAFTLDGQLDYLVTNEGQDADALGGGKFRRPCHFSQRGTELLVPDLCGRVTVLDGNNAVLAQLGDNPNAAQRANNGVPAAELQPGVFCTPHGATWDRAGNIYVAEWLPYGRVTKLRRV